MKRKSLISTTRVGALALGLYGASALATENCLPAPAHLLEKGTLTIGTTLSVPPMEFTGKSGQADGFDPGIGRALAKGMCLKPKFVNMEFSSLMPSLNAHRLDIVIASAGITPERKQIFDFIPYFVGGTRMLVKASSPLYFKEEKAVCGNPVAVNAGSVELRALQAVQAGCPDDKAMAIKIFPSQQEAMNELLRGTVEVAYVDWPLAGYAVRMRPTQLKVGSPILSGKGSGTPRNIDGIIVRKGETDTLGKVTAAFMAVQADGQYEALLKQWGLADGGDVRKVATSR